MLSDKLLNNLKTIRVTFKKKKLFKKVIYLYWNQNVQIQTLYETLLYIF